MIQNKPMGEILKRMELMEFLEIIIFDETMILNDPIDSWPICDCLISFHSKGKVLTVKTSLIYRGSRNRTIILTLFQGSRWKKQSNMKNYENRLLSMTWKNSGISKAGFDQSFLCDRAIRLKIVRPSPDSDLSILLYKGFQYQVYCSVQSARSMTFQ